MLILRAPNRPSFSDHQSPPETATGWGETSSKVPLPHRLKPALQQALGRPQPSSSCSGRGVTPCSQHLGPFMEPRPYGDDPRSARPAGESSGGLRYVQATHSKLMHFPSEWTKSLLQCPKPPPAPCTSPQRGAGYLSWEGPSPSHADGRQW